MGETKRDLRSNSARRVTNYIVAVARLIPQERLLECTVDDMFDPVEQQTVQAICGRIMQVAAERLSPSRISRRGDAD